jgi:hypothetical protein
LSMQNGSQLLLVLAPQSRSMTFWKAISKAISKHLYREVLVIENSSTHFHFIYGSDKK